VRSDYQELCQRKREQESRITDIKERQRLEIRHFEDVRAGINDWNALRQELLTSLNTMVISKTAQFFIGTVWQAQPKGTATSLVIENEGFYPILINHLVPPVVDAGFWGKVDGLIQTGSDLFTNAKRLRRKIIKDIKIETGVNTITIRQNDTREGVYAEFPDTIIRNALGIGTLKDKRRTPGFVSIASNTPLPFMVNHSG
jgi:hypothetical protein